MKVEVKKQPEQKPLKFPCLMISQTGLIIIATEIKGFDMTGVVICNNDCYEIGHFSKDWHAPSFKPFSGTVTLQNKNHESKD